MTDSRWRLVPVEPSEGMVWAPNGKCGGLMSPKTAGLSWTAMLSAAPSPLEDEELVERLENITYQEIRSVHPGEAIVRAILKELTVKPE